MGEGSRVKNSSRNIVFSLLAYMMQIILGFVVRRYFIYFFNEEYLGLSSLFTNILNVLSLAELGFGTAIVFAMYKPIAEKNEEEVRELLYFYKKCYRIVAIVVALLGVVLIPFIGGLSSQADNVDVNIYIVYIIYLFNSVTSYIFAYRRSLLYTNQRNDIESRVNMCINLMISAAQLLILFFVQNFYLYVAILGVAGIINNMIVAMITQKMFPEYVKKPSKVLNKETKKSIMKNIYALVCHRIGGVIVYSTDSIIIYMFLNAATLGKYSNYLLINTYITSMLTLIANAVRGSLGNSVASESRDRNFNLLSKLNFIFMWLVSFCTIAIFVLADPFIDTVLTAGESNLTLDSVIVILASLNFYFTNSRTLTNTFKECVGMFYQDRFKPLVEGLINLVVSILLVKLIGLPGVIIGTIISTLTTSLWIEPYVLHKHYFKKSMSGYWIKYLIYTISMLIAGMGTYLICGLLPTGGVGALILKFAVCAVVPNVILLACLFWMPEFRECVKWGISIIKGFKNKRKNEVVVNNVDEGVIVNPVDIDKDGIIDITVSIPTTIMEHEKQNESITENIQDVVIAENIQNKSNETDEN